MSNSAGPCLGRRLKRKESDSCFMPLAREAQRPSDTCKASVVQSGHSDICSYRQYKRSELSRFPYSHVTAGVLPTPGRAWEL